MQLIAKVFRNADGDQKTRHGSDSIARHDVRDMLTRATKIISQSLRGSPITIETPGVGVKTAYLTWITHALECNRTFT